MYLFLRTEERCDPKAPLRADNGARLGTQLEQTALDLYDLEE